MNNPESMQGHEQDIVEQKIRLAVGINALRKIGAIVAREQQADTDKINLLRWFARYGGIIWLGATLLMAYVMDFI